MNAPTDHQTQRARPALEYFPHQTAEIIRYSDMDGNNHVNNAVFSTFFDAGRVTLLRTPAHGLTAEGTSWALAQITIDYLAEMHWPGTVQVGIGVLGLGRTSVTFQQALYFEGRCVATARAVNVNIDLAGHRPVPLTDQTRSNFRRWMLET